MKVFPVLMFLSVGFLFAAALLQEHGKWAAVSALVCLGVAGVCAVFDFTVEITRT